MTFGIVEILLIAAVITLVVGPAKVFSTLRKVAREADKVDEVVDALPPGMQPRKWQAMRKGMQTLDALASKHDEAEEIDEPSGEPNGEPEDTAGHR